MALFDIKNSFNYLKCVKCNEIPKITIDLDKLSINVLFVILYLMT